MVIIGVDPAKKEPAWSKIEDGQVTGYGKAPLEPLKWWFELFKGADIVVIEDQYLGVNVHSLIVLAHITGKLAACAELAGARVNLVKPASWQKLLGLGRASRGRIKHLSKVIAGGLVGKEIKDSDVADAVLMAEYGRQVFS